MTKTITFQKYPQENDVIIIRKANGVTVELDGNGRTMNGETAGQIHNNGTAIEFYYFIATDEWFAR